MPAIGPHVAKAVRVTALQEIALQEIALQEIAFQEKALQVGALLVVVDVVTYKWIYIQYCKYIHIHMIRSRNDWAFDRPCDPGYELWG